MIRYVMLSFVLMLCLPVSGWATNVTGKAGSQRIVSYSGAIEAIDRQKKTKITVNGITYSISRSIKVKVANSWASVSNLSVGDTIRFTAKAAKSPSKLPEIRSIELQLN